MDPRGYDMVDEDSAILGIQSGLVVIMDECPKKILSLNT